MMPSGMPIAIASSTAITPSWNETGSWSRKMSLTLRLLLVKEGPKFIHRKYQSPTGTSIRNESSTEGLGGSAETRGTSTSYTYCAYCCQRGQSR